MGFTLTNEIDKNLNIILKAMGITGMMFMAIWAHAYAMSYFWPATIALFASTIIYISFDMLLLVRKFKKSNN